MLSLCPFPDHHEHLAPVLVVGSGHCIEPRRLVRASREGLVTGLVLGALIAFGFALLIRLIPESLRVGAVSRALRGRHPAMPATPARRSAAGRSSMHLLGCLDTPTAGCYLLEGRDMGALTAQERARVRNQRIGFVFQILNLLPRLSATAAVWQPRTPAAARASR